MLQAADCLNPPNPIVAENCLEGAPRSEWDVSGAGSPDIQGFATQISVNRGETVSFKVDTDATAYRMDVYRLGYYAGLGARLVATVCPPPGTLPQAQPPCLQDPLTGLIDCGNWAVSLSWAVPADAVSGIYIGKLVREDAQAGNASHVIFVVRDDDGASEILFQTSDTTWQAYNRYGGNSLYVGSPAGRAFKVSYNRPFSTRGPTPEDWVYRVTPSAAGTLRIISRAVDDSGNVGLPSAPLVLEAQTDADTVHHVFAENETPANPTVTDNMPIEVGVKFFADVPGEIRGVRFYKGSGNIGTHVGHLWSIDGTLLAEAEFTGESAVGWQEVRFPQPVPIQANTLYVASYHSSNGFFAINTGFFSNNGIDRPPLHLPAAGGSAGVNGVFRYGPSGFPTDGNTANYWVDVVFGELSGDDTTPPTILSVSPAEGAIGVAVETEIHVRFSEAIDPATLDGTSLQLRRAGTPLSASIQYDAATRTARLIPDALLSFSTIYEVQVGTGILDPAGNALALGKSWTFTTTAAPPPPPDQGPGGPILLITGGSTFGNYYAEILRAEGLNAFFVERLPDVTAQVLAGYRVAILAGGSLDPAQVTMFSDWVTAGGKLIAMRPDPQLAPLLGLARRPGRSATPTCASTPPRRRAAGSWRRPSSSTAPPTAIPWPARAPSPCSTRTRTRRPPTPR